MDSTTKRGARDLLLKELKDAGVTPNEEDDGRFSFWYSHDKYHEHIVAEARNDYNLVKLYDLNWYEVSQWDVEKVNEIQKKVNNANLGNRAKIVYALHDDDMMRLSSIVIFPFTEDTKDRAVLLSSELRCLEDTHCIIDAETVKKVENVEEGGEA